MLAQRSWKGLLIILLLLVITLGIAAYSLSDKKLHVYFFDVGQGDSILIKEQSTEVIIDGGPTSKIVGLLGEHLPPWDRKIELIILTHPHADHVTGLVEILKRYEVGEVWGSASVHSTEVYISFLQTIRDKGIPFRPVKAGETYHGENFQISVLYPLESLVGKRFENANDSSVVTKLTSGPLSVLLTGDIEATGQQEVLGINTDIGAHIIKVPHQGSRDANVPSFLQSVKPVLGILSVGKNNTFGHPHRESVVTYANLNIPLLRTDQHGTIHVILDGATLWTKTEKKGIVSKIQLED